MRAFLFTAAAGLAGLTLATSTADSAPVSTGHASQCFTRAEVSGFARHDAHSALVRVDNDRVFPLKAVGDCVLFEGGRAGWVGRSQLISRTRDWFCTGDTADLLPMNPAGRGRCAVTIGSELHR